MNKENIIRMALAAGIYHEFDSEGQWDGLTNEALGGKDWINDKGYKMNRIAEILGPFAELVAKAERQACMDVCDDAAKDMTDMARWGAQMCRKFIDFRNKA